MENALLVGFVRDRAARNALQLVDVELLWVSARAKILTTDFPRRPRLFLMQSSTDEVDETRTVLQSLRRDWPLTDVVIWAPLASGAAVRGLFQAGAKDVIVSRSMPKVAECIHEALGEQRILPRINDLSRRRSKGARFENMFSCSAKMWDLFELCTQVAPSDATVLIVGETGTGKELLARAVHRQSGRRGRFVTANCASIPRELINSELFGHEKGAFTGADRSKRGLVLHANEGTLFLDEIGDMPPEAQQTLLRMLQEKRIRPVGSLVEAKIDVRIVAATNVQLDSAVNTGDFREDLFYRLDVIRINVPALRERHEDILFLFGHFTKRLAKQYALDPPIFTDSFLDALLGYDWPGNVRQLENFSERLVLSRPQRALTARDFDKLRSTGLADIRKTTGKPARKDWTDSVDFSKSLRENLDLVVEGLEREYLQSALQQSGGRIARAAEQAGISRRTLLRKMNLYGLNKHDYRE